MAKTDQGGYGENDEGAQSASPSQRSSVSGAYVPRHSVSADPYVPRHSADGTTSDAAGAATATAAGAMGATNAAATPEPPRIRGKVVNAVICGLAFIVMLVYLLVVGEGSKMADAMSNMGWRYLALGAGLIVIYWILEAGCLQLIIDKLHRGFSFFKTNVVVVIGQYFNCITPLSSGGQPLQAYYFNRFGLPLSTAMSSLLARFIVYQFVTTAYCAIVLALRYQYFTVQLHGLMTLSVIGFIGGLLIITGLLFLAFADRLVTRVVNFSIDVLHKLHLCRYPEALKSKAAGHLKSFYVEIRRLLREPRLLVEVALITFVQLTVFFSLSYVIYVGFGFHETDYLTVISCQAFIYMISSFIPTPGAAGAAEGSYIAYFSYIYPDATYVALSTFIWRAFTFYLPIVVGMVVTLIVNHRDALPVKPEDLEAAQKRARKAEKAAKRAAQREAQRARTAADEVIRDVKTGVKKQRGGIGRPSYRSTKTARSETSATRGGNAAVDKGEKGGKAEKGARPKTARAPKVQPLNAARVARDKVTGATKAARSAQKLRKAEKRMRKGL